MTDLLDNYKQLVTRVDTLCEAIKASLGEQITCAEGCGSCCTSITIFPVEAAALQDELNKLPQNISGDIRLKMALNSDREHCPLLSNQRCMLYPARPIICRTHGLPIIYTEEQQRKSDCCPLNMIGSDSVTGSTVIDLDKLNPLLVAVNALFLSQAGITLTEDRLSIAEALADK